jgi:ADP-ribose pyrophosphatase
MKNDKPEVIESECIYQGTVFEIYRDQITLGGPQTYIREKVIHHGGAAVALQQEDGRFIMVEQYRYGIGENQLEFVAGKKDDGEDGKATVLREAVEETGWQCRDLIYVGSIVPTGAYDSEVIDLFYAKTDKYLGQHLDEDERLKLQTFTLPEIITMIMDGRIRDSKTVALALMIDKMEKEQRL